MKIKELKYILKEHGWNMSSCKDNEIYFEHENFPFPLVIPSSDNEVVPPYLLNHVSMLLGVSLSDPVAYNSTKFYEQEIENLKKEKASLEEKLNECSGETSISSQKEQKLEEKLNIANKKISEFKQWKLLKEQKADAEEEWNNKITEAFKNLETKLDPIKKERVRLNCMYYASVSLIVIALVLLAIIEYKIFNHFTNVELKSFLDYLPYCSSIPFIGVILWIAIYQMNKSQRQLFVLAEQIHNINYIEGLMLALNQLAPDINNSVYRLNKSIDKIIDNQLIIRDQVRCDEEKLKLIEKKDNDVIPTEALIEVLKTCLKGKD